MLQMIKKNILFGILVLLSLSLTSAVIITNTTITSSGGDSIYSNSSNIEQLTVTDSNITITNALDTSIFTAFSNMTSYIRGLTSPFDNIFWDYANTIIDTVNEDILLTIGQRLQIYSITGTNTTIIINNPGSGGGGTTTYIEAV